MNLAIPAPVDSDIFFSLAEVADCLGINHPRLGMRWCRPAIVAARDGLPYSCD